MAARARSSLLPPRALLAKTRRYIGDHNLIAPRSRVLAGVSGGPDSTALLLILAALRSSLRFELVAAHFDHGLRGARAGERERESVRALCQLLGVPFRSGTGDVRAHATSRRLSIEEAARELRYRYLARAARAARCGAVAAGHTRDDQAETVLMHLLRGSGLRGLAGMSPSSAWPLGTRGGSPQLLRPLLCLSLEETNRCCTASGIVPLSDPSNRSRSHLRNRIRHDLLPHLRRYNPRVDDALVRLAGAAARDVELLELLATQSLAAASTSDGRVRMPREGFVMLPEALRTHVVRLAVARILGDARGLREQHVQAVVRAAGGPRGRRLDLPRRLTVRVSRDMLEFSVGKTSRRPKLPAGEMPLAVPGNARIGSWRVRATLRTRPPANLNRDSLTALLDADACDTGFWLRRRRHGDRFQPLGLGRPKKLQDFFVDAHVPREQRDAVPLLVGERGIAWVVGQRPAEWAKITPRTRRAIWLQAELDGA